MDRADAFATLGLPETATDDEIRAGWRLLIAQVHPDGGGTGDAAVIECLNDARTTALGLNASSELAIRGVADIVAAVTKPLLARQAQQLLHERASAVSREVTRVRVSPIKRARRRAATLALIGSAGAIGAQ